MFFTHISVKPLLGKCLSVGALALGLGVLAAAQPGYADWRSKTLASQSINFSYQTTTAVAVGPQGDAVAAWVDEGTSLVRAAVRRAGAWGSSRAIYRPPVNAPEEVIDVRVAMGGDGTAFAAVLLSHFERGLAYTVVIAATMTVGAQAWSPGVEVSSRGGVSLAGLGADAAGNALVLWTVGGAVLGASRPASGAWSAPQLVPGCPAVDDFAMNAAGEVVVAWRQVTGATTTLRSATRRGDGSWLPPADIVDVNQAVYGLHTGIDGDGLAAVAWIDATAGVYSARLAREVASGVWSAPATLNAPGWTVSSIDLGAAETGDLAIAWSERDPLTSEFSIHAQFRLADGSVREHSWLTTEVMSGFVGAPSVAVSPDGSLVAVAWIDDGASQAFGATFTRAMDWSAPAPLGTGLIQNRVSIAAGPAATAGALWPTAPAFEFRIGFRAATYELAYPKPALTSLNPRIFRLGSGPRDVVVSGSGFLLEPGMTSLLWDGAARPTDIVSSDLATAHLSAADLAVEGAHAAAVSNTAPGGGVSGTIVALVDGTAPVTTTLLNGRPGANGWYNSAVSVTLVATDALSGVSAISYRLDDGPPVTTAPWPISWSKLTSPKTAKLTVTNDNVHTLVFFSTDNAGVEETATTRVIRIDSTAPALTMSVAPRSLPASPGAVAMVHVSGTITDAVAGIDPASVRYAVVDEYGTWQPAGALVPGSGGELSADLSLDTTRKQGDLDGRTYTVRISGSDLAGLSISRSLTVRVR